MAYRKKVAGELFKGLAMLRGGAKMTQFGMDLMPKAIVIAGLDCKNPLINNVFKSSENGPTLNIDLLKELLNDYHDRFAMKKLYIGLRKDYLANEADVLALHDTNIHGIKILVDSPKAIIDLLAGDL